MSKIPPKMLARFFAIIGIIVIVIIVIVWAFFLVLQKAGQVGSDREDTGGSRWHVIVVQPTTIGNGTATYEDIFEQEMG